MISLARAYGWKFAEGRAFFGEGIRTSSMILTLDERQVRFIESVHLEKRPDIKVRFTESGFDVEPASAAGSRWPERRDRPRQQSE